MAWPKGKPRPASKKKEGQNENFQKNDNEKQRKSILNTAGDSLVCIHCRERIGFDGKLPAKIWKFLKMQGKFF